MKFKSLFIFFSFLSMSAMITSCSSSKKGTADAAASTTSDQSMIEATVSSLDNDASLVEKSANLKAGEKGTVSIFSDANGNIKKITKNSTSSVGEKTSKFYFEGSDLIASSHFEKNTVKAKGKLLFTATNYFFKNGKVIGSVMKSVKLKPSDEVNLEMKMNKEKFKSFVPSANIMRDELAIIKKIKQLIK
ncbi:MAG: hypothetical protein JNK69_09290 [Saprospiraceae bacterium]|nr:hypothetical protein [Candidatus Vicinibacter proximus]MBL7823592.1 hypothetical protein [Saprospiraceae bacterium]MCC6841629.1 hypothetical protein [Saprospiraceae bacterium]HRG34184.1 hypothetical protein [Saprospiraceae bacterium]